MMRVKVTQRVGVMVRDEHGAVHALLDPPAKVPLTGDLAKGDPLHLTMEQGPYTDDYTATCEVIGVLAVVAEEDELGTADD